MTGVAVIMLGCGIGTLGSTFNAFATVVGSNAAGVPFTDGLLLRVFILFACLAAGILFVMRYAQQVKAEPGAFGRGGPARGQCRALPQGHRG